MKTHKALYCFMSMLPVLFPTGVLAADPPASTYPIGRLKAQVRMLRGDIETKNARIGELNRQIEYLKSKHQSQVARFQREIAALQVKLERLEEMFRKAGGRAQTQPMKTRTDKAPPKKAEGREEAEPKDVGSKSRTQPAGAIGNKPAPHSKTLYEKYKNKYAYVDGEYVTLPDFDLRYRSSRMDAPLPRSYLSVRVLPRKKVARSEEQLAPIRDRWRTSLPCLKVGQFGRVENFSVHRILGPDDMVVYKTKRYWDKKVWRERLIRIKGFPTAGLDRAPNMERILGAPLEIGIIGTYSYSRPKGRDLNIYQALPMSVIRKGLSEQQFEEMLERGIDPEASTTRPASGGS